jgi:hypothetical protein
MAVKFEEFVQTKVPQGTREAMAKIAARKYDTISGLARKAIMEKLEQEGVRLMPAQTKAA